MIVGVKMFTFQKLEIYQLAKNLVLDIYKITNALPKSESFGLVSQMNRSAISIPSNIAEGYGRKNVKERVHFYNIARSSLFELFCQIEITNELNYINEIEFKILEKKCNDLSVKIAKFCRYNSDDKCKPKA